MTNDAERKKKKTPEQKTDCCAKLFMHDRNTCSSTVCENHTCSQTVAEYSLWTSCFLRLTLCSSRPSAVLLCFFSEQTLETNSVKSEHGVTSVWRRAHWTVFLFWFKCMEDFIYIAPFCAGFSQHVRCQSKHTGICSGRLDSVSAVWSRGVESKKNKRWQSARSLILLLFWFKASSALFTPLENDHNVAHFPGWKSEVPGLCAAV